MKKIFFLFLLVTTAYCASAQERSNAVKLYVEAPSDTKSQDGILQNRLLGKIKTAITQNGIAEYGYSNFYVLPKLEVIDSSSSEAGMSRIYQTVCELYITVERKSYGKMGGAVFNTFSKRIVASSLNKNDGKGVAINSLNATDPDLIAFIEDTKKKISDYYQQHCTEVIAEAKQMEKMGEFAHSVALYFSVPSSAPSKCFKEATEGAIRVYKAYINTKCQTDIVELKAQVALALRSEKEGDFHYEKALEIMEDLDPASPECYAEAVTQIQKIEDRFTEQQKKDWELKKLEMNNAAAIEKKRLKAISRMNSNYTPGTIIIQNKN